MEEKTRLKERIREIVCDVYGLEDPALIGDDYDLHFTGLHLLAENITDLVWDVLKFPGNTGSMPQQIERLVATIRQRFQRR